MPSGLDYFGAFDAFSLGAIAVVELAAFVLLFTYLGLRGEKEKPLEKASSTTLAALVAVFFLSLFGFPSIITGFAGVAVWSLALRHYAVMERRGWAVSFLVLWAMLALFAAVDDFSRIGLILFALAYAFIDGERKTRKKEKGEEEGKKGEGKEKKDAKK